MHDPLTPCSKAEPCPQCAPKVTGYRTLQFAVGGLFDARPVGHVIHLVRSTGQTTPGPTLCGIDRFAKDAPGWSVGGGVTDPQAERCQSCADAAGPLPIGGMFAGLYETAQPL